MHAPALRTWIRASLVVVVACGGGAATRAPASHPGHDASDPADPCRPAYAAYEARWRVALSGDLTEISGSLAPDDIAEIVASQVATLPTRDELAKLRTVNALVELFVSDAPWPLAFAAADLAIARCGDGAARPH